LQLQGGRGAGWHSRQPADCTSPNPLRHLHRSGPRFGRSLGTAAYNLLALVGQHEPNKTVFTVQEPDAAGAPAQRVHVIGGLVYAHYSQAGQAGLVPPGCDWLKKCIGRRLAKIFGLERLWEES